MKIAFSKAEVFLIQQSMDEFKRQIQGYIQFNKDAGNENSLDYWEKTLKENQRIYEKLTNKIRENEE